MKEYTIYFNYNPLNYSIVTANNILSAIAMVLENTNIKLRDISKIDSKEI